MPKDSKIAWTDHTWNPVTGCSKVSPGCDHCYAERLAERFRGQKGWPVGFDVQLRPNKLSQPMSWKEPSMIFVNSMSDLFHRDIPDDYLRRIWDVMLKADHHTYQALTKRPHRMAQKIADLDLELRSHIWLGTSAENQLFYDSRVEALLSTPADVKFISAEPLLGPIDLKLDRYPVSWVIVGGESGPGRRPLDKDWVRDIRDQCAAAGVPWFYKQGNASAPGQDNLLDGIKHEEYPAAA